MPRVYKRKPGAYREKLTVPVTSDLLRRLREFAVEHAQTPTAAARDLLTQALEPAK